MAQGALGIECLAGSPVAALVAPLDHAGTRACVEAERSLSFSLGGSCQVPLGGYCVPDDAGELWLRALVGAPDGTRILRAEARGGAGDREQLGREAAAALTAQGADAIIAALASA